MTDTDTPSSLRRLPSRRRRSRWRWGPGRFGLALLAVAGLLGGVAYVSFGTDLVTVKTVQVRGAPGVPRGAVLSAAQVPVGTPMARLDGAAVRHRVLAAMPGIAAVSVERKWPSTVRLVISERIAVAAVPQAGRYLLVDRTGLAYRTAATVPAGLVTLRVSRPKPQDAATKAGISVLLSLPPEVRRLLARVEAPTAEQVVLVLRDKRQVIWGGANDSAQKAAVARVLLGRPGKVIDVSAPGLATVR